MRLYHFLNETFGLKDLRERRLRISRITELNDPFEFLGASLSNRENRKALSRAKASLSEKNGPVCFLDFSNTILLKQVIVGADSSLSRKDIMEALGDLAPDVEVFKARAAFKTFRIVGNKKVSLWT